MYINTSRTLRLSSYHPSLANQNIWCWRKLCTAFLVPCVFVSEKTQINKAKIETKENKKRYIFPSWKVYHSPLTLFTGPSFWLASKHIDDVGHPSCLLLFVNFFVDKCILCYLHFESWNNIFKQENICFIFLRVKCPSLFKNPFILACFRVDAFAFKYIIFEMK